MAGKSGIGIKIKTEDFVWIANETQFEPSFVFVSPFPLSQTCLHFYFNVLYRTRSFWCFRRFFFFFFSLCFLEGFLTFLLLVFDGFESFPLWFDFMPFWLEYRTDFFAGAFSSASLHLHQQVLLVFCGTLLPLPDTLRGFTSSSSSSSYSASSKCCPLISTSPELLLDHR